jgi:hypothetical protein
METLTGYKVAKLVNHVLTNEELDTIPPQQVYRYMKEGLIPTVQVNGQNLVTVEDATAWCRKYVAKRQNKAAETFLLQGGPRGGASPHRVHHGRRRRGRDRRGLVYVPAGGFRGFPKEPLYLNPPSTSRILVVPLRGSGRWIKLGRR